MLIRYQAHSKWVALSGASYTETTSPSTCYSSPLSHSPIFSSTCLAILYTRTLWKRKNFGPIGRSAGVRGGNGGKPRAFFLIPTIHGTSFCSYSVKHSVRLFTDHIFYFPSMDCGVPYVSCPWFSVKIPPQYSLLQVACETNRSLRVICGTHITDSQFVSCMRNKTSCGSIHPLPYTSSWRNA
jgi:hypothetical protein